MNQEYRDKIKEHKSTHTKMSAEDRAAVTTLESFLTSDGKINTSFSSDDKWPNHDGYFEFVSNPSLSRSPDQNFVVQIKGTHCYKETNGTISYSLTSLAFPAYIADEVTADPGILFVVLNPDVRGEKRVFWKYISPQVIEAIDFNKDSTTIKFSSDEEIFDTDESVENFCRSLEKIVSHHLFLRKLDMTSLSPEDALKIVDARCCDISEEIDRINQDNSSRDKFSRRIINCLYDLCYSALILNASRLGYKDINERFAWELSQFNISTKYLSVFLAGLKYIEHRIPDDGQSERLMLKYYSYLWEIRRFLYECFNKSVLQNLEAFPLDLDSVDTEYYEMIASSIENSTIIPSALRASRYYVQNSTPFFVNGERYFEITLQLAGLYATKFNRLTVYSKLNISSNYSIQISYCNVNINLWGKNNTIKFVTGWKVAIDPICLNKLGKILNIPLRLNRTYGEYISLMDFLTNTGMNLLDIINLQEDRFAYVLETIYQKTNTETFKEILLKLRKDYASDSSKFGCHTIRYILLNLHEEILEPILLLPYETKRLTDELYITTRCYPFEKNPFISNLAGRKTQKGNIFDILAINNDNILLKAMMPYRIIESLIKKTGELFFDNSLVAPMKDIKQYNDRLDTWEKGEGFSIEENNGLLSITSYVDTTLSILKRLIALSKIANKDQGLINTRFLKNSQITFDDPIKRIVLEKAFVKSQVLLIYGAAGTGKTTLMNHLSDLFKGSQKLFLAKTHTALHNLKRRIHNANNASFESVDSFAKKTFQVHYDIVFIDECSIIDNRIMKSLLEKIDDKTLLVLAGDIYQIESIDFGNWFYYAKDVVSTDGANIELLNNWRTEKQELKTLWDEVRNKKPLITEKLVIDGPFSANIGEDIFTPCDEDEVILCLNYNGKFGLNNMNLYFQNANNNSEPFTWAEWTFKIGDKVIFVDTKRSALLYNNLKGKIVNISKNESSITFTLDVDTVLNEQQCLGEDFEFIKANHKSTRIRLIVLADDENITEENRLKTIIPFQIAYAVSIHKAQGLEFNSVKIIIPPVNAERITHSIFYTAITRAKEQLKIYWSAETMKTIISSFTDLSVKQQSLDIIKKKLLSEE